MWGRAAGTCNIHKNGVLPGSVIYAMVMVLDFIFISRWRLTSQYIPPDINASNRRFPSKKNKEEYPQGPLTPSPCLVLAC